MVEDFGDESRLAAVRAVAKVLSEVPGCSVRVRLDIAGAGGGTCRLGVVIVDGRLVELSSGRLTDVDCTVSVAASDACGILGGDVDPSVAYMQGRLKIEGAYEKVLFGLRPMLATQGFAAFAGEVQALFTGQSPC